MHMSIRPAASGSGTIHAADVTDLWNPTFIADVRSRVPHRLCDVCGESIGAARLTLRPDTPRCAWCASLIHSHARPG